MVLGVLEVVSGGRELISVIGVGLLLQATLSNIAGSLLFTSFHVIGEGERTEEPVHE